MTFGAVFAAILSVLAAADPARADPAASAPSPAAAVAAPAQEPARAPQPPPSELRSAPAGAPLSESGAVLIDRLEYEDGWALERLLEPSGDIVEHVVNRAGTVQSCRPVGSLHSLRVIDQRPASNSGALLRFSVGSDGEPRAVGLLAPPPR